MQQVLAQAVGNLGSTLEAQLDAEMKRLDDPSAADIAAIRKKRLEDIKKRQAKSKEWLARGHGEYSEIFSEAEFFKTTKGEERMICHFYRDNWPCKVMDKHLSQLAKNHLETKVVKINAEKSPFLTDKLKVWMLPTLALIKNEKVDDYVVGFAELGNTDDFDISVLEQRLAKSDIIDYEWPAQRPKAYEPPKAIRKGGAGFQRTESDEDSDLD